MATLNPYSEGTWHIPIITAILQATPGIYVEIGVRRGDTYNQAAPYATHAHAVDPEPNENVTGPGTYWPTTSDQFFLEYQGPIDVAFIDGDHTYQQAARDYTNTMDRLTPDGTILLHDTWPVTHLADQDCGTVWQLAQELEHSSMNVVTIRRYPGLTIIQRPDTGRWNT